MSGNIHTFNDNNNDANPHPNYASSSNQNPNPSYQQAPMFMSQDDNTNPREEKFGTFIKKTCCPTFSFLSVVFIVSVIDAILYIATLCFGIKRSSTELLAPLYDTLQKFGMKMPAKIYNNYQVWRWLTFGFLHANFIHIVMNLFSQIIIGSMIEQYIGHWRTAVLYLACSIGGGIFSSLCSKADSVGASVAIFGLVGAYFAYTVLNWNYLDEVMGTMNKFCNMMFMIFIVIMNLFYGLSNDTIDNFGHLGGLIFGFFLPFVMCKPISQRDMEGKKYKICLIISIVVLTFGYIGEIILFYTVIF